MADGALVQLDPISGEAHGVGVTLAGLSVRETDKGRRYAYPDFGSDFIDALHKGLVRPARRGLIRSTMVCPRCEASIDGAPTERVMQRVNVVLKKIPSIQVDLDMMGMTCPNCRGVVVKVDRDVESDISDALIAAFATMEIKPG